jgi:hypothetical protein
MKRINKLRVGWFLGSLVATVLGWFLLMHGGIYGEAAERSGDSAFIYKLEVWVGQVLTWPITLYGWVYTQLSDSNVLGMEAWFFQFGGYFAVYKLHANYVKRNT